MCQRYIEGSIVRFGLILYIPQIPEVEFMVWCDCMSHVTSLTFDFDVWKQKQLIRAYVSARQPTAPTCIKGVHIPKPVQVQDWSTRCNSPPCSCLRLCCCSSASELCATFGAESPPPSRVGRHRRSATTARLFQTAKRNKPQPSRRASTITSHASATTSAASASTLQKHPSFCPWRRQRGDSEC